MKEVKLGYKAVILMFGLTVLIGFTTAHAADENEIRLTIGSGKPIESGNWISSVRDYFVPEVSKKVETRTKYKIKWTEGYSGTIAKPGEVLEAVEMRLMDIGFVVWPFEPAKLFLNNYSYWVPFCSSDTNLVAKASVKLHKGHPFLEKNFETYNQKLLGISTIASYQLITTFPVTKLDDLKGRKIAAAGPNLYIVKAAGAVPVQSGIEEGYTSFKTGVYDGWLIMEDIMAGLKWPEVAPYITLVDIGAVTCASINVNLDTWKKLPSEVRDILVEVGDSYSLVEAKMVEDSIEGMRKKIIAMGGKITPLSKEDKKRWTDALPNQPNIKAKEADGKGLPGSEIVRAFIKYQKELGYEFPREWVVD